MPRAEFAFSHRFRVRYAELDPQAVVFNARYLEYADLAITEYWRAAGLNWAAEPLEFHVARATVQFRKPIRADEEIDLLARTVRIGTSSVTTLIELHGAGAADDLRAEIELVHVHVELESGRSAPVPAHFRAKLAEIDQRAECVDGRP